METSSSTTLVGKKAVEDSSMATPRKLPRPVLDIKRCTICSETFKEPKLLPCIHTFCLHCLQTYAKDKKAHDKIACPLCSKVFAVPLGGFVQLPSNHFINQLLRVNALPFNRSSSPTQDDISCELCCDLTEPSAATSYCIQCSQYLCALCSGRHKKQKFTKTHQMFNLTEQLRSDDLIKMAPSYCEQHPSDEIKYYCYDCHTTECVVCCLARHSKHDFSGVNESAKKFHEQLKQDLEKVVACAIQSQEEIRELEDDMKAFGNKIENTVKEISQKYDQLKSLIHLHRNQLMIELNSFKVKRLEELDIRRLNVQREFIILESFNSYCNAMKEKGSPCDISRSATNLHVRAEELVQAHEDHLSIEFPEVDVTFTPAQASDSASSSNWIGHLCIRNETRADKLKKENTTSAVAFLRNPTIVEHVINAKTGVIGITALGSEIFVASESASQIDVYTTAGFALVRQLAIPDAATAGAIVACAHYTCLYLSTSDANAILYRFKLPNISASRWSLSERCYGLSVTRNRSLLVTLTDSKRVQEYTTKGSLIREIPLDISDDYPYHCVQLSTLQYVVCHSEPSQRRVCVVDANGTVVHSYEGPTGLGGHGSSYPVQLAIDRYDNIFVTDYNNNRVQLLSSSLVHLGDILTPGHQLVAPWALYLDDNSRYLYIGEYDSGRIIVLTAKIDA